MRWVPVTSQRHSVTSRRGSGTFMLPPIFADRALFQRVQGLQLAALPAPWPPSASASRDELGQDGCRQVGPSADTGLVVSLRCRLRSGEPTALPARAHKPGHTYASAGEREVFLARHEVFLIWYRYGGSGSVVSIGFQSSGSKFQTSLCRRWKFAAVACACRWALPQGRGDARGDSQRRDEPCSSLPLGGVASPASTWSRRRR